MARIRGQDHAAGDPLFGIRAARMIPGDTPLVPRDRWFTARGFLFRQPARRLRDYPWWPVGDAIRLQRYITALLFIAHASMRFIDDTIAGFGAFMEARGFVHGEAWVLAITK